MATSSSGGCWARIAGCGDATPAPAPVLDGLRDGLLAAAIPWRRGAGLAAPPATHASWRPAPVQQARGGGAGGAGSAAGAGAAAGADSGRLCRPSAAGAGARRFQRRIDRGARRRHGGRRVPRHWSVRQALAAAPSAPAPDAVQVPTALRPQRAHWPVRSSVQQHAASPPHGWLPRRQRRGRRHVDRCGARRRPDLGAALPGRKASMRSRVIVKPAYSSGARPISLRPCTAIW